MIVFQHPVFWYNQHPVFWYNTTLEVRVGGERSCTVTWASSRTASTKALLAFDWDRSGWPTTTRTLDMMRNLFSDQ